MWMQLSRIFLLAGFGIACSLPAISQNSSPKDKIDIGEVEVDILSSYYEQDGEHSAVEGGDGSQSLQDMAFSVVVNIPIDTVNIFNMSLSADTYTSASCDHIDGVGNNAVLSTPSSQDTRTYGNLSYSRITRKGLTLTIGSGFSYEFDVSSVSGLLGISKESKNHNREISLHMKGYHDKWTLIYPVEFRLNRSNFNLPDIRNTLSTDISYAQVINKRLQMLFSYETTIQKGLLSTPFHRVYFNDGTDIFTRTRNIESLPGNRFKHAFSTRISTYPVSWLIGRFYYRYYFDTYNISAHTTSAELPFKITRFFSVYPFYRYYIQTASTWFHPYGEHDVSQEFYTSDYDLSAFTSNKVGVGFRISPPMGILHTTNLIKSRTSSLKGIELRLGRYSRSDGLSSFIVSSDLNLTF